MPLQKQPPHITRVHRGTNRGDSGLMGNPKLRHSFLGIALEWCRAHRSRGSYWEILER